MNITDKSFKIKTMGLCYIALSRVDSLVPNSYQLSVKFCLELHFKKKTNSQNIIADDTKTCIYHALPRYWKNNF